jgi:HK97 family phage major capsid protein
MNTNAVLTRLQNERAACVEFVEATMGAVDAEQRDLSDTETRALESQRSRIAEIDAQIAPLAAFLEARAAAIAVDASIAAPQARQAVPKPGATEHRTLGQQFIESPAYTEYRGGSGPRLQVAQTPTEAFCTRAVLTTTDAPAKLLVPNPVKWTAEGPALLTPLLNSISRVGVNGNAVDVVKYGEAATGAAVVPEGELKPEGTFTLTSTTVAMETIAVTAFASRQLLRDAPQARQFLDTQMARGVLRKLESEVTAAIAGATVTAATGAAGQPLLEVVRLAQALVQTRGYAPDVIMANPTILAGLDLGLLGLGGASAAVVGDGYWGLRAIAVPGLTDAQIYVADASAAITLFERTGIEQFVTDSDVDEEGKSLFRRNVLSFVTELAAVGEVTNASAIVKCVLTASP